MSVKKDLSKSLEILGTMRVILSGLTEGPIKTAKFWLEQFGLGNLKEGKPLPSDQEIKKIIMISVRYCESIANLDNEASLNLLHLFQKEIQRLREHLTPEQAGKLTKHYKRILHEMVVKPNSLQSTILKQFEAVIISGLDPWVAPSPEEAKKPLEQPWDFYDREAKRLGVE